MTDFWKVHAFSLATTLGLAYTSCAATAPNARASKTSTASNVRRMPPLRPSSRQMAGQEDKNCDN